MSDEDWATDEWHYTGRRLSTKSKALHRWVDQDGETYLFSKAPTMAVIGGVYAVEHQGDSARIQAAKYLRTDTDHPDLDEWRLADRAASAELERIREVKRASQSNSDIGAMTLSEVRALMATRLAHQRAGTLAAVLHYLGA